MVWCGLHVCGVQERLARVVPSFASWSLILFPIMPVCALRFWIMVMCVDHMIRLSG